MTEYLTDGPWCGETYEANICMTLDMDKCVTFEVHNDSYYDPSQVGLKIWVIRYVLDSSNLEDDMTHAPRARYQPTGTGTKSLVLVQSIGSEIQEN